MKRIITIIFVVAVTSIAGLRLSAQNTMKFAHINNDELVRSMPEFDSAMVTLEK
ncbi:MAG: OmpH family outer membrane protein, partial [Bacteroidetes bacterium]|nr:OmpH family outer membrane protein [Bacteroidota bacterium]